MKTFIIFILMFAIPSIAELKEKNVIKAFFWTSKTGDSLKYGCYGYNQIISVSPTTDYIRYLSVFGLPSYNWWKILFSVFYIQTEISTYKSKPSAIIQCPDHFKNVGWFGSFKHVGTIDSLRFYFPLLPQNQNYGRYDYFHVDMDDSMEIHFYGAGDSIMVGTFVYKKPDGQGITRLAGRQAFIIELTNSNPFRIKSIRCDARYDSLINLYLGCKLETFKKDEDWYGVDIIDTVPHIPRILYSLQLFK